MTRRLVCVLALCAAPAFAQDVLVIAPEEFQGALDAWKRHRTAQGHTLAVQPPGDAPGAVVKRVHAASGGKLRFVLLLGDVKRIPCTYEQGEVIKIWERDPRIANDNHLADLDGDGLPDLAVGRLPADNAAEAKALLAKGIAYETDRDFSTWRRRVNVVAGVGGFGALQDWALEQVATKFLRENVPPAYDLHVTYGNPSSPFCPPPADIAKVTLERFNEGALIVTYLGHGNRLRLDALRYGNRSFRIFDEDDAEYLEARRGAPIAFFCACSTGHFDGAPDCLAEVALKKPKGPIAIYAASRVSMPYANAVFAKELLDAMFGDRAPTAGEALMVAKRRMMQPRAGDEGRRFIEALALPYKWKESERAEERAEHLYLYNLLGDPCLRLPLPRDVAVTCAEETTAGGRLKIEMTSPVAGEALIELVADRSPAVPPRQGDTPEAFAEAYARANQWVKAAVTAKVGTDAATAELAVPDGLAPGAYFVRVYVAGSDGAALGARPVAVKRGSE